MEGLQIMIVEFTYCTVPRVIDGQLVFSFGGEKMDNLIAFYPDQGLCELPLEQKVIAKAVKWAEDEGYERPQTNINCQTIKEVVFAVRLG
jgi:hypothetical protein